MLVVGLAACGRTTAPAFDVTPLVAPPAQPLLVDFGRRLDLALVEVDQSTYDFGRETAPRHLRSGWSAPEHLGGESFAWAIEREADLSLWVLDRSARWLHFAAQPFDVGGERQSAIVRVNGIETDRVPLEGGGVRTYTVALVEGVLRPGENIVSFEFAYAVSPQSLNPEALDERPLAAAFRFVSITTAATVPESDPAPRTNQSPPPLDGALVLAPMTQASFRVPIPADARLEFGLVGTADPQPTLRSEVAVQVAGEPEQVILSQPSTLEAGRWLADLSSLAGSEATLLFRVVGDRAAPPVHWTPPRLYGQASPGNRETSVALIVVDTLRSDVLGSYGGDARTPNIDALAATGGRFERAYAHVPLTVPSHSSMFTSLLPTEHAAVNNGHVLSDVHLTLAERLRRDTHRRTSAFVSLGVLKAEFGLAQGFDEYYDAFDNDWWKTAEAINADLLPWVSRRGGEPFFLWAHYSDPHEPYAPPNLEYPRLVATADDGSVATVVADGSTTRIEVDPRTTSVTLSSPHELDWPIRLLNLRAKGRATLTCESGCIEHTPSPGIMQWAITLPARLTVDNVSPVADPFWIQLRALERLPPSEIRARYLQEVEYVDQEIGKLLAALREQTDDLLVIFTSDHGEDLGEHGGSGHGNQLYDTVLRVPFIFNWPGVLPEGVVVEDPVSHVDLLPTVLALLDVADGDEWSGRSLVPHLLGSPDDVEERLVVAGTFRPGSFKDRQAIVARGHKLIETPEDRRRELYDLERDPGEQHDIARANRQITRQLTQLLHRRLEEAQAGAVAPEILPIDEEQLERFRALGYVR